MVYGSHLINDLLNDGLDVIGLDNLATIITAIKYDRVEHFQSMVETVDMKASMHSTNFGEYRPEIVIHLGVGVRDSFGKEVAYHKDNIDATQNLIECCKMYHVVKSYMHLLVLYMVVHQSRTKGWTEDTLSGHQRNTYAHKASMKYNGESVV